MSNASISPNASRLAALAALLPSLGIGDSVDVLPNFGSGRIPKCGLARRARRSSEKPKPIHKSLTLRFARGPGSIRQFDQLVSAIGRRMADRIWRCRPGTVEKCLADVDPCSFAREALLSAA